jgi:hypothetical protein
MLKEKDLNIREQDSKLKHKTDLRNATANDTLRQSLNG